MAGRPTVGGRNMGSGDHTPFQLQDSLQLVLPLQPEDQHRLNLTSLGSYLWPLSFWEGCGCAYVWV